MFYRNLRKQLVEAYAKKEKAEGDLQNMTKEIMNLPDSVIEDIKGNL